MAATTVNVQMQQRRDTAAGWTAANSVLLSGELGFETDTNKAKLGDGSTAWNSLAYLPGFSVSAYPLATADIADDAVTGDKLANDITIANDLTVTNNLTVNGTTTTINSTTLQVDDKNIELGTVDTPSDTTANGGGITLKGATDHTIIWTDSTDSWDFSEHVNIASGKEFQIDGTSVLNASTLGSGVTASSLTSVGTITTGTWNGTAIATAYIADDAITADKLADTAVTAGSYTAANITVDAQGRVTSAADGSGITVGDTSISVTDTGSDGTITFDTDGSEAVRIDSSGRVGINTTAPATELEVKGDILAGANSDEGQVALPDHQGTNVDSIFQINTQGNLNAAISLTNNRSNSLADPAVLFGKAANNISSPTVVGDNQSFGHLVFSGYDGSAYVRGAQITAQVDGTPAAGSMPGRIVFSTTADSASSPSERVRITSSGNVGIGTSTADAKLDVSGDARLLASTGDATLNLVSSANTLGAGQKVAFFGASRSDTDEEMAYIQGYLQSNSGGSGNIQLGDLIFGTSGSERLRINSSGVVSVETGYLTLKGNKVGGIEVTVADDAFVEITPPRAGGGWVFIATEGDDAAPDADAYGQAFAVWGTTASVASASGGASFETSTSGPPTGTTGSDAHATLFVGGTSGRVYLENRLGASKTFQITFL